MNEADEKSQNKGHNHVYLILIISIGFIVRLFTYSQVVEPGRIVFLETDPYYHMSRVFSFIDIFPRTFLFDPNINYPYGFLVGWPPLFDQSIAFISLILGLGNPGLHLVESVGAFMPVLLGVFSIISVYYITKEIFNERIALYSSLLIAVMPAHSQVSFLGFTDHHIAEVLLSVLAYMFFLRSIKKSSRRSAITSGVFIGISFLTWTGAPIFIGILLSYALIQFIIDNKHRVDSNYLVRTGMLSFLAAFFVVFVFYLWVPWLRTINSGVLSYFHLIYLAASAALMLFFGLLSNFTRNKKWYYYPFLIVILTASLVLLLITSVPSFYSGLLNGIGYLLRDTPALKLISEAQPLFYTFVGKFLGWQVFSNPVWYSFTFSFYTAIIGFVWLLYSHREKIDKAKTFFIIWTLIVLILALYQRRFVYTLSINIAILSGYLIDRLRTLSLKPYYVFLILVLVIPNIAVSYDLSQTPPKPSDDWYDSLIWLRENTPSGGQYGIMTWWDYGNWILYISKRPVVANNFQIGGDEAARFFLADNETLANTIMDARKARYVVVDRKMGLNKYIQGNQLIISGTFFAVAGFADKDISQYFDEYNLPNENYYKTMYSRMHVFDGVGLQNYRLVFESGEMHPDLFGKLTSDIKIFEYVKGAKIAGKASSGKTVSISGKILTDQKRILNYSQETKADVEGNFELVLPYSNDSPYETRLLNGYELKYDNFTRSINVSENDVINGKTIMVNP